MILGPALPARAESLKSASLMAESLVSGSGIKVEMPVPAAAVSGKPAPGLVAKFQLKQIHEPSDPALRAFVSHVRFNLGEGSEEAFLMSETVTVGRDEFQDPDLVSLLNGRFNGRFLLDLSIPDAKAATREGDNAGLIVTGFESLYCSTPEWNEKNAERAVDHFLPFKTRRQAEKAGLDWAQADLDETIRRLEAIVKDCRYSVRLLTLSDTMEASLNLVAVTDTQTGETEIIGFGANP